MPRRLRPILSVAILSLAVGLGCVSGGREYTYRAVEARVWVPAADLKEPVGSLEIGPFESRNPQAAEEVVRRVRSGLLRQDVLKIRDSGASAVLRGSVEIPEVRTKQGVDEDGRVFLVKTASVTIHYRIDQGGRQIAGRSLRSRNRQKWYGANPSEATARASGDQEMVQREIRRAAKKLVAAISPQKQKRRVALLEGSHSGFEKAYTYVDNGRTDQAFGLYEHIRMQADDPIDQAAAAHNMGVVSELDGRFGDAFEYYADADQLDPANPIIVASLTRVEKQKNRRQRVKARREDAAGQALLVNATPVESRIRIVNIEAAYHDDMLLPPGEYDLQVDAPGYRSHREWVVIEDEDVELDVVLEPKR